MKSLLHFVLALLPCCCDAALLLSANRHALQAHSAALDETRGLTSQIIVESDSDVEDAPDPFKYTGDFYDPTKALALEKKRDAWRKKNIKAHKALLKKCKKCLRRPATCTGKCKKFSRKPLKRTCKKGKKCYRNKYARKAHKKRMAERKKCSKCLRGKGKCTVKCQKLKDRKPKKECKGNKKCYTERRALAAAKKRRAKLMKKAKLLKAERKKCHKKCSGRKKWKTCNSKCMKVLSTRRR